MPTYKRIMDHEATLKVGDITAIHDEGVSSCSCQGYKTNFKETLQQIISTPALEELFEYLSLEQQVTLFNHLKSRDPKLYSKLDSDKRTILVRVTGKNFLAAQFSRFSISSLIYGKLEKCCEKRMRENEKRQNKIKKSKFYDN